MSRVDRAARRELAPGSRLEAGWHWLAVAPTVGVYPARRFGALSDGGVLESEFLFVGIVEGGRATRLELFEIDAVEAVRARSREIAGRSAA